MKRRRMARQAEYVRRQVRWRRYFALVGAIVGALLSLGFVVCALLWGER